MINLPKQKILITGANGFLGKHLVEYMRTQKKVPKKNLFLPTAKELDLRSFINCQKAVRDKDMVIHLAARVGGIGLNLAKPGELFYDNLVMGAHLMEAARQAGVKKFVAVGTVCAYPKFTKTPFKEASLWNGYPEETNAPYGLAKKMLLVQAQAYRQQYGFNAIFLLPVNMYGPGDNFEEKKSHVIAALVKKVHRAKAAHKKYIQVWGTGKPTREFLYVKDGAKAIALAAERYSKPDPVNIGSGKEISIKELVKLVCKLMNFRGEIRWNTSKPDGQPKRRLNIAKAKKEFGFTASTNFVKGLKETIDWYEQHS